MMKKLVALLMALALLCTSIGAFAEEEIAEEPVEELVEELVAAPVVETEEEEVTEEVPEEGTANDEAHKHDWKEVKRTGGKYCTDPTLVEYECSNCKATKQETVTGKHVAGADDEPTWIKQPTCTEKGKKHHTTCSLCSIGVDKGGWDEIIKENGHTPDPDQDKENPPTCEEAGTYEKYCTVCNTKYTVPGKPATGHNKQYANGYIPATCTSAGQEGETLICTRCGKSFDEEVKDQDKLKPIKALNHVDEFKAILNGTSTVVTDKYFDLSYDDPDDATKITGATLTAAGKAKIKDGVIPIDEHKQTVGTTNPGNEKEYVIYGKTTITYVPATCTTTGSITFKCEACAKEYKVELKALDHHTVLSVQNIDTAQIITDDKDFDCVKGISIVWECDRPGCDYFYNERIQNAAHDFSGQPVKYLQKKFGDDEPVEYAPGQIAECIEHWEVYRCSAYPYCKVTTTKHFDPKPEAKHVEPTDGLVRVTPSTCISLGGKGYNCAECFNYQYEEFEQYADHDWDRVVKKAATCTEDGLRVNTCKYCGKVEEEVIPAIGHDIDYTNEVILVEANCKKHVVGTKAYKCVTCGYIAKTWTYEGHKEDATTRYETNKAPKCTEDGEKSFYCPVCCRLVVETIPATGHSFEWKGNQKSTDPNDRIGVEKVKAAHEKACKNATVGDAYSDCKAASCSAVAPHGTIHTLICRDCGTAEKPTKLTWTEAKIPEHTIMKNAAGVATNFTIDVAPTCCKPGSATFTCAVCHEAVKDYVLPALGHNKVPKYDSKKSVFVLTCQPLAITTENTDTLKTKMKAAGYKDEVAELVMNFLLNSANGNYRGIGYCGWTEDIEVVGCKYDISVTGSDATIKLSDPTKMVDLQPPYLRVNWRYRLNNGDTVSFNYTFAYDEVDHNGVYSYFIDAPDCDGKLEMTYIEVVGSRTAHRLDLGEYATYGSKKL